MLVKCFLVYLLPRVPLFPHCMFYLHLIPLFIERVFRFLPVSCTAGVESAFAQTDRASGLLPPLHSSSFRASMNRPAARNSMNSTRAHWALDPHALEEAALARRGVLLARIVQGVNLHAVGLSEVELQRDGAQHVSLVNESLTSDQDSRGRSSCSTLSRRNHLELARGGGTFRICLLLPDGGVGGCGDAYASPWAQAAINLTGQPGKSSEVAEGSHAAAHVLWNGGFILSL
jgi:hypothetical protein